VNLLNARREMRIARGKSVLQVDKGWLVGRDAIVYRDKVIVKILSKPCDDNLVAFDELFENKLVPFYAKSFEIAA
jgi:hypothetical protein